MKISRCVAAIALLPMLVAATAPPVRLSLHGGWTAEYRSDSCRAIGQFGEGSQTATVVFEQVSPDNPLSMLVVSNQLQRGVYGTRSIAAYFMPEAKAGSRHGQSATANDAAKTPGAFWSSIGFQTMPTVEEEKALQVKMMRQMQMGPPRNSPELPPKPAPDEVKAKEAEGAKNLAAINAIQVMEPARAPILLEGTHLSSVVAAIEGCSNRQLAGWGIDPLVDKKIVKRAELREWWKLLGPANYPTSSLRKGEESALVVRMLVDANGTPTSCTPVTLVNPPTFGKTVCARFMKGRADPAQLEDGTKVPSYLTTRIVFRMAD